MSHELRHLIDGIDESISSRSGVDELTSAVRVLLAQSITRGAFVVDALKAVIDACARDPADSCIYQDEARAYRIQMFFWPAGAFNTPHQHNTWSVTGVFHNENTIETFDTAAFHEKMELRPIKHMSAKAGAVGRILPPCIHKVGNTSGEASVSLHIFKDSDDPKDRVDDTFWFDERGNRILGEGRGNETRSNETTSADASGALRLKIRTSASILSRSDDPRAGELIEAAFDLAGLDLPTRFHIVKSLMRPSGERAVRLGRRLRPEMPAEMLGKFDRALAAAGGGHV